MFFGGDSHHPCSTVSSHGTRAALRRIGATPYLFLLCALGSAVPVRHAWAQGECCAEGPHAPLSQNCNVIMIADDQITACPGGDSVNVFAPGHPKSLRVRIHFEDNDCKFKVGVPPESVWVTYAITQGHLKLNDKATKVFADEYTDEWGDTWITLKCFSGCGAIRCSLFVSGKFSGYEDRLVRTTDQSANGRTEQSEGATPCDLKRPDAYP